jgi:hypothetical protein
MRLGIVGHEAAKFTPHSQDRCEQAIWDAIADYGATEVISGGCHLGGVDIWAIEVAEARKIPTREFLPVIRGWEGGYKQRNMKIAENSDYVLCFVVDRYPENYKGMRFDYCYHCGTKDHIKSGGCWTVKYAKKIGKDGRIIVV